VTDRLLRPGDELAELAGSAGLAQLAGLAGLSTVDTWMVGLPAPVGWLRRHGNVEFGA